MIHVEKLGKNTRNRGISSKNMLKALNNRGHRDHGEDEREELVILNEVKDLLLEDSPAAGPSLHSG